MDTRKYKRKSSPEARAKAKAELDEVRKRLAVVETERSKLTEWATALRKAARFVCDVNGDPPSIDHLRTAVEAAERHAALSDEWRELRDRRTRLTAAATYYQWIAGTGGAIGFLVRGQGDTRAEAIADAQTRI
jgi:predicted nuclease with TOPRIM domain